MSLGLEDGDIERLQERLAINKSHAEPDGTVTIPYADQPRAQATVLRGLRAARSPAKAGDVSARPRVALPPCEVGKCLATLADEDGVVERVRYSNGSWWWREVDA